MAAGVLVYFAVVEVYGLDAVVERWVRGDTFEMESVGTVGESSEDGRKEILLSKKGP